jgi:hypothetical protein
MSPSRTPPSADLDSALDALGADELRAVIRELTPWVDGRLLPLPLWPSPLKGLSAFLEGFSLEAGTHVHENDRADQALEVSRAVE